MASKITNTEEVQESELVLQFKRMVQEHGECQRKAKERIEATKLMGQEIDKWVANSVANGESGNKETLKELSSKYDPVLKDGLLSYDSGQPSLIEGGHVMAEYEALASSVLQLMKQAEDEATGQRTEEYGKYAEGCFHELYESLKAAFDLFVAESRSPTSERIREIALDFSDLLEVIEREKQSLDKLTVHLQICQGLIDKPKEAKTIGKLQSGKLAAAASNLERSCDAFLMLTT